MLEIGVVGHITLDIIRCGDREVRSIGGPPIYMGLLLRRLGADVTVITKVGYDFGDDRITWVMRNGLQFGNEILSDKPTTRFLIEVRRGRKKLTLLSRCSDIETIPSFSHLIVNPVANEVKPERIKKTEYLYVDPQGFLRDISKGLVTLRKNPNLINLLHNANTIKVDLEELYTITSSRNLYNSICYLHNLGVNEVILSLGSKGVILSCKDGVFLIESRYKGEKGDLVGLGDLLGAGYVFGRIRKDPIYGLVLGYASVLGGIRGLALEKIPTKEEILEKAEKLANEVKEIGRELKRLR